MSMPASSLLIMSFLILFTLEHRYILTYAWHVCPGLLFQYRAWPLLLKTMLLEVNLQQVLSPPVVDTYVQRSLWWWSGSPTTDFHGKLGPLACYPAVLAGWTEPKAALGNTPQAYRPWHGSSWGITDCEVPLSKSWKSGSCRASSSGGRAGAGIGSLAVVATHGSQPSQTSSLY